MKVVQFSHYGGPEVLEVVDRDVPDPQAGQLLIKASAIGVNFADTMQRANTYPIKFDLPFVPGYEASGTIESVGEGVTGFEKGQRVTASLPKGGGYAEYVLAPAQSTFPLPDGVGDDVALALQVQGLTAYFLLKEATRLEHGNSVLIHAAAGGVGTLAVQLAKLWGAAPVIGAASPSKLGRVSELGADVALDYTQPNWSQQVRDATQGNGVDIILDPLGDSGREENLKALAPFGRWAFYGTLSGKILTFESAEMGQLIGLNQSIHGFSLSAQGTRIADASKELFQLVASEQLRVEMGQQWPLAEAADSHRALENRETTGKVVLIP